LKISSTTVSVAGDDYVVVASDTRLTENYAILSRTHSNVYKMYENLFEEKQVYFLIF
jgi:20S proteasome alpha/beta subunit